MVIRILKDLLYFVLYILFVLVLSPFSLMFWLYKIWVKAIVQLFLADIIDKDFAILENECMAMDSNYLKKPNGVFSMLVTMQGSVDIVQFKKTAEERVFSLKNAQGQYVYDRFRQFPRKLFGYYFYQWDKNFDINNHITEFDKPVDQASLDHFLAYQARVEYQSNQPLWDAVIVHKYNGEEKTLLYWRFHHTIGDGISIVRLIMSRLVSGESLKSDMENLCKIRSPESVSWKTLSIKELYCKTLGWPRQFAKSVRSSSALYDPMTAQNSDVFVCSTKRIPMSSFKVLKRKCNLPMTVALIASISYALQKYLKKNPTNNRSKSDSFSLSTIIPPSREHTDVLINDFRQASVEIPISSKKTGPTVWTMSSYIMKEFDKLKLSMSPLILVIETLISVFPIEIYKLLLPTWKGVLVSNMMGPSLSASVFGSNSIEDVQFWMQPAAFPSLTFSVFSYNGNIKIGLMGCSNVVQIKDLEELARNIELSLSTLFCVDNRTS